MILNEEPNISVGILSNNKLSFSLKGIFYNSNKKKFMGDFDVVIEENQLILYQNKQQIAFENEFHFIPQDSKSSYFILKDVVIGKAFHWQQKESQSFYGKLKLIKENKKITAINIVPLDTYIESVISSEMNATSFLEFLKAHAVISRSWIMAQIYKKKNSTSERHEKISDDEIIRWYDRDAHKHFDVCADDHCQRYQGINRITNVKVKNAVKATQGMFLTYKGQICDTRFSKCCGGISENYENVWDNKKYDYLKNIVDNKSKPSAFDLDLQKEENAQNWIKGKPAAFCNTTDTDIIKQVFNNYDLISSNFYRWKINYSQKELSELLKSKLGIDFGYIKNMIPLKRGYSGRLIKLKIIGSKKTLIIGKELEIRRVLSKTHLYSSAIIIDKFNMKNSIPQYFTIFGAGWGHGVGLCQIGAAVMASKGFDFKNILQHYFHNTSIKKVW